LNPTLYGHHCGGRFRWVRIGCGIEDESPKDFLKEYDRQYPQLKKALASILETLTWL